MSVNRKFFKINYLDATFVEFDAVIFIYKCKNIVLRFKFIMKMNAYYERF